jgi:outer membrane receptor for ferrienterochelin and colicins
MRAFEIAAVFLIVASPREAHAQNASLRIEVRSDNAAVGEASVVVNGTGHRTDAGGVLSLDLQAGPLQIVVVKDGLEPLSVTVDLRPGEARAITIDLQPQSAIEEHVTVAATRTDKRLEDQPMRVEVLGREEIEEKLMMTPGDIVMMLNEMGGLRVQATSPSLGAASVRIQGMRGRYTRFLSEGLPLFGQQVGSFGLLQIPPTDLGQVEVIKGVASSLYGAGAMGGVVNLVSRRPGREREREVLVNRSSRGATDGVIFYAAPLIPDWGLTLLAGAHGQEHIDVNGDGWADLPKYVRGVVRPRLFWDNHSGRSFFATMGAMWENRNGGTMPHASLAVSGTPYLEALDTRRYDGGVAAQTLVGGAYVLTARASFMHANQRHRFGEIQEADARDATFAEAAVRHAVGRHTWVVGAAIERERFRPHDVPQFAYTYSVPGLFAQDDLTVSTWLAISVSGRMDVHSQFGRFVSPRASALFRRNGWSSRLSFGTGFFAPTPLSEEVEAAGLARLVIPRPLEAERARSISLDVTRSVGSLSGTLTLFTSRVSNPTETNRGDVFTLRNLGSPSTNRGIELLGTWRHAPFSATVTYTYVRALERPDDVEVSVPLTPRHNAGLIGMWERPDKGRIGLEWYYTGEQRLEANPYRDRSRPYVVFGALVERRIGRYRLFVNAENLGDVRQTDWDPLIRPARAADGRWTVDAWAPLDGRNINGGIRVRF